MKSAQSARHVFHHRFWLTLLICGAAFSLTSCERSHDGRLAELSDEVHQTLRKAEEKIGELGRGSGSVQKLAGDEVEKLFIFEYELVSVPIDSSKAVLESTLQEMGKERWDCFHTERLKKELVFFCKRRPKTYLRYIPSLLP